MHRAASMNAIRSTLAAINPWYAIHFLLSHGTIGLVTLGAVFLAVTGAEALYADLGHFGRVPIQRAWLGLVFPALTLNYLGQGALILTDPTAADNPFYRLAPTWALIGKRFVNLSPIVKSRWIWTTSIFGPPCEPSRMSAISIPGPIMETGR